MKQPQYDLNDPTATYWPVSGHVAHYSENGTHYKRSKLTSAVTDYAQIEWTRVTGLSPLLKDNPEGVKAVGIFCKDGKLIKLSKEEAKERWEKHSSKSYKAHYHQHKGEYTGGIYLQAIERITHPCMPEKFSIEHLLQYFPDADEFALVLIGAERQLLRVCKQYPVNQ